MTTIPTDLLEDVTPPPPVAKLLGTTEDGLAQMRYRGTGPKFIRRGRRILYRWSDVRDYLDANTRQRTEGRRDDRPSP